MTRPIDYAKTACDTIMQKIQGARPSHNEHVFFYIGGVFLSGMQRVYFSNGREKIF
ncbi:MAG: hypothetical protein L6V93_14990 [Clostridiales bacterium]|nr:MAG: hypothetical protein L6V93_14990 [Clostridiales bacterium]